MNEIDILMNNSQQAQLVFIAINFLINRGIK